MSKKLNQCEELEKNCDWVSETCVKDAEGETSDEVLANVMLYRYEHNISILDDEYSIKTIDYARRCLCRRIR